MITKSCIFEEILNNFINCESVMNRKMVHYLPSEMKVNLRKLIKKCQEISEEFSDVEWDSNRVRNQLYIMQKYKLSNNQREVIIMLQDKKIIQHKNDKFFYSNGVTIRCSTIFKLEKYGLIKRTSNRVLLTKNGHVFKT